MLFSATPGPPYIFAMRLSFAPLHSLTRSELSQSYTSATKRRKAQAQNGWATDGRDPQYHIRTHTIVDTH